MGALFAATILAYWITRTRLLGFSGEVQKLPGSLYVSTVALLASSVFFERAQRGIARNLEATLKRSLYLGGACAVLFLCSQTYGWTHLLSVELDAGDRPLTLFTFYLLTGVHALHVIGGFVPLAWVMQRAAHREYSSSRYEGVRFCVQYWHFLLLMWLLVLAVMLSV